MKLSDIWKGSVAVCIGGGPSLTQEQVDYVRGRARVIAINDAYRLAPWADVLYACDVKWWDWHYDKINGFKGAMITQDTKAAEKYNDLFYVRGEAKDGLSLDPGVIHTGRSSGYQAVNLAVLFGAKKIILIGYDHGFPGNKAHWFGDHPDKVRSWYERWIPCWETLPDQLKKIGVQIINCTPDSALTVFEYKPLNEAI